MGKWEVVGLHTFTPGTPGPAKNALFSSQCWPVALGPAGAKDQVLCGSKRKHPDPSSFLFVGYWLEPGVTFVVNQFSAGRRSTLNSGYCFSVIRGHESLLKVSEEDHNTHPSEAPFPLPAELQPAENLPLRARPWLLRPRPSLICGS